MLLSLTVLVHNAEIVGRRIIKLTVYLSVVDGQGMQLGGRKMNWWQNITEEYCWIIEEWNDNIKADVKKASFE
jgi:hypothetical protein